MITTPAAEMIGAYIAGVRAGMKLPRFTGGNVFSTRAHNRVIQCLNPLLNIQLRSGGAWGVFYSDNEVVLQYPNTLDETPETTGSSIQQYKVIKVSTDVMAGDYIYAATYDGSTTGSTVNIAKPYELRHSITSETIDGISVSYGTFSTTNQSRVATGTVSGVSVTETHKVTPRYKENDLIYVATVDHTGVTVSSVELTLIDINADGRAWSCITV